MDNFKVKLYLIIKKSMKFLLVNSVTKKTIEKIVTDENTSSLFYQFNFNFDELVDEGSWTYTLYDDKNKEVATGIAIVGDYNPEDTKTYKEENKTTYKQYNG